MDKIALITGGMGEIATSIIQKNHKKTAKIIAVDIVHENEGKKWLDQLAAKGINNVLYRKMDVTSFDECKNVITNIIESFGRIDILINNAGITKDAVFHKMTVEQWNDVLSVNLNGMFNVTRNAVGIMREQKCGRIINLSSVNGQKGQFSQANYASSKAGVFGFTKSLAQELMSKNITVNSISPGYVDTHLMKGIRPDILEEIIAHIPAKRLAHPDEIAWVVEFLIDENSQYITGANININGGLYME